MRAAPLTLPEGHWVWRYSQFELPPLLPALTLEDPDTEEVGRSVGERLGPSPGTQPPPRAG